MDVQDPFKGELIPGIQVSRKFKNLEFHSKNVFFFKIRYLRDYFELEKYKYFATSTRRDLFISGVFWGDGED